MLAALGLFKHQVFWQLEEFVAVLRAVSRHGVQWGACCNLYHVHLCLKKIAECQFQTECIVFQPINFKGFCC